MAYFVSETGNMLIQDIKNFSIKEIQPNLKKWDREEGFPEELYIKAGELGYSSIEVPEEYGGFTLPTIDKIALIEEISYFDSGVGTSIAASNLAVKTLFNLGSESVKKKMAETILSGKFASFAITEESAGSDAKAIHMSYKEDNDEFVIDGSKAFVTNGNIAAFYIVTAKNDDGKISLFLVESDREGVCPGKPEDKLGIRLSDTCQVDFNSVRIPKENILGEEGEGLKQAIEALEYGRILIAAAANGISQRCIDEARKYSGERKQFGKSLLENQSIKFKLAEMEMKTESARQMIVYAATLLDKNMPYRKESSMAKVLASDGAVYSSLELIQILGGYGYTKELIGEKLLRDSKIFQIFEGTNEIQRLIISV